jgi:hypothetical protein
MRLRHFVHTCAASTALAFAALAAGPALAQDSSAPGAPYAAPDTGPDSGPDTRPDWKGRHHPPHAIDPGSREAWLSECRRRISVRDNGVGGAVIGGLVGGFAGNRIAGRGHRTVGTIAGAAVGAAAGMAIDKAEDNGRVRDECETYLDEYYAYYAQAGHGYGRPGYGHAAYGYGCCRPMMMVPVKMTEPECTETIEEIYEDVPVRPRARRIPDKRVKVVPDKRVKTN